MARIAAQNGGGDDGGGSGLVESTQWRIVMSDKFHGTYIWAEEFIFRTSSGGAQQALDPSTGSATATSELATYDVEQAFDNTDSSPEVGLLPANPSEPVIVQFTFNESKAIT